MNIIGIKAVNEFGVVWIYPKCWGRGCINKIITWWRSRKTPKWYYIWGMPWRKDKSFTSSYGNIEKANIKIKSFPSYNTAMTWEWTISLICMVENIIPYMMIFRISQQVKTTCNALEFSIKVDFKILQLSMLTHWPLERKERFQIKQFAYIDVNRMKHMEYLKFNTGNNNAFHP